jgi:putative CocE/NonD family hydrolase
VSIIVYLSSTACSTDVTAKLVDVFPDGRAINLADGITRWRRRDGSRTGDPSPPEPVEVDLWATSNVFLAGHRIRVDLSSSNFPRFDRNLNTGGPFATEGVGEAIAVVNRIHTGPNHLSRLIVPIVDRR